MYNVRIIAISFSWDARKNTSNTAKHGISFIEAQTVFYDDEAIEFFDEHHSQEEERYLLLGCSTKRRLLMVCYCVRNNGTIIRIISARKATKKERTYYL